MKKLITAWVIGAVLSAAFWVAVVYVAVHFIAKAW